MIGEAAVAVGVVVIMEPRLEVLVGGRGWSGGGWSGGGWIVVVAGVVGVVGVGRSPDLDYRGWVDLDGGI